uniref:Uncharacterized protein n=1 Tax=Chromera velia CCMP2878 TaxID=1169474 RepID=A0A0G4HEJ1_9ALVE|mmetsp:Transcript_52041/g.101917  ORF Transcript_52041/g.101917 Transcript_52041/m.101917 type:complete len:257 (+) Transcript_52041:274-1044(+)|eukprot:Cvel_6563.t1-p1 / transcript=Cvel_6563.t1 / gene=Cvel_6563 / organism=Chromera_velia_CCMP2878 / gene_product=hypothetical protein / transcript_product=hypothetical protein / location=Cvel_scaffold323:72512-75070(+) / protein_length=256 / sequence_SO=supercontig / SO=protein_coding / is_pseudo=false
MTMKTCYDAPINTDELLTLPLKQDVLPKLDAAMQRGREIVERARRHRTLLLQKARDAAEADAEILREQERREYEQLAQECADSIKSAKSSSDADASTAVAEIFAQGERNKKKAIAYIVDRVTSVELSLSASVISYAKVKRGSGVKLDALAPSYPRRGRAGVRIPSPSPTRVRSPRGGDGNNRLQPQGGDMKEKRNRLAGWLRSKSPRPPSESGESPSRPVSPAVEGGGDTPGVGTGGVERKKKNWFLGGRAKAGGA